MTMIYNQEENEQIKIWIAALRSKAYGQTKGRLERNNNYCCLGVACKVLIPSEDLVIDSLGNLEGCYTSTQIYAPRWLKNFNDSFNALFNHSLSALNDSHNLSFTEIADIIESAVFSDSAYSHLNTINMIDKYIEQARNRIQND